MTDENEFNYIPILIIYRYDNQTKVDLFLHFDEVLKQPLYQVGTGRLKKQFLNDPD